MENSTKIALGLGVAGLAIGKYIGSKWDGSVAKIDIENQGNTIFALGIYSLIIGGVLLTTKNHPITRVSLILGLTGGLLLLSNVNIGDSPIQSTGNPLIDKRGTIGALLIAGAISYPIYKKLKSK